MERNVIGGDLEQSNERDDGTSDNLVEEDEIVLEDRHSAIRSRGNERRLTSGEVEWCEAIFSAPWNGL